MVLTPKLFSRKVHQIYTISNIGDIMKRFWDWYDRLAGTRPILRFSLFLGTFILLVTIPGMIGEMLHGWRESTLWQLPGVFIMALLAFSKVFRWPR